MARRKEKVTGRVTEGGVFTFEKNEDEKGLYEERDIVVGGSPLNQWMIDPPTELRISKSGAYITIVRTLPVEPFCDTIKFGMTFFAQHVQGADAAGFDGKGMYKVVIDTPWGSVHVWPYEYLVMPPTNLVECYSDGDMIFHPAHTDEKKWSEQVLYCQSRGIPLAQALPLCLGSIEGRNIGWFEIRPELQGEAESLFGRVRT